MSWFDRAQQDRIADIFGVENRMGRSVKDGAQRMRLLRLRRGFTWITCVLILPAFDLYLCFQFPCVFNLAVDGGGRWKNLHWFCSSHLAYELARF